MCTPQCICEKLGGLCFEKLIKAWKYVRHYTENLQKLQVKLRDLDDCMEIITREVSVANGRGDEIKVNVQHWQTDAVSSKDNIEQLIGESTTKASISCIACSCPNIVWRYKFSKQAEEKIAEAVELIVKYNNFNHQISHPRSHYAENLQKLKAKLRDLDDCRGIITRKVSEANGRGDEIEVNVLHWQTDAGSLINDIEQLIREDTTKANICSTPDITWQSNFSKQAEEKIADADGLIIKYNNFNQISHRRPRPPELESVSDKNYVNFDSRASIFKDVMDALKDSNVNMIGVFGLGGVGKTTLVKEVGEQMRKDGTFKQVAMAVVSKDLNVKEVQSRLADSLNFEFEAKADYQERRATELQNKLANGDKYLIILDDIWEKVDLKAIGIPITDGKTECKVVLTSRNEDLLSCGMDVNRNFSIGELLGVEAWTLFTKKVGNSFESQPELYSLAYKVCKKCKGLPIAINALGEALKGKQQHAWTTALDKLEKYMLTKIEGIHPSVLASLRVSYDMLHSTDAKSCFLLCCLFAEDAEIPIDELMRLCVARNLLDHNPDTLDKARNAVRAVVDTLKSASLLTTGGHETVVKIHDVIRDVGISIAREEEAFLVDHGALRWPRNPTDEPLYKAMSLSFKNIKGLPDGLVYPRIHTLMVENTKLSDLEVGDNFFNGMTQLAVLTFTQMRMQRLPSSLAKLTNLKMLYLNECELTDIAVLKDLKSNLAVLSLRGSGIKVLPPEIGQLTSLRVLDLQNCYRLLVIPRGVISNLTGLEELYFPMTFDKWGVTTDEQPDTNSRYNASLEELRGLLAHAQLTTLHIHVPNVKLLPKEDLKFADLKGFRISVGSEFNYYEALISRTCMLKLEGIQLRNEFIPLVDKAEVLVLKLESSVPPLRLFNKLTVLIIEHFKLKYLFSPTIARGLVHLEVLKVTSCEIMEGMVGFEGQKDENEITGEVKFSKLKRLALISLPNLISFFAEKEETGTTMGSVSARPQPLFNEQVIFPVLEGLTINGLGNIIKIWDKQLVAVWQEQRSFCQLTSMNVNKCKKLMHVFPSNMHLLLENLKGLEVRQCETMNGIVEFEGERDEDGVRNEVASPAREHLEMVGVIEIQDKQSLSKPREEVESLCKLVHISIEKCDQLLYVFPSHMLPLNLQELDIRYCKELEVIFSKDPKEEKEAINDGIIAFPRLKALILWKLPKLKSFYSETQGFFSHKVAFPVLEKLSFWSLDKITRIWDNQPLSELEKKAKSFCQLMKLNVNYCNQLEYVLPSYMLPQLENLEELKIQECRKMEVIISNNPQEKEATNNNDTIRFPQLKKVELWSLPNLKSFIYSETQLFFSNKVAFPILEKLILLSLDKITRIWDNQPLLEPEKEAKSFSKLQYISVDGCNQLEYVLPFYMLPQLKNILQELSIRNCTKVEVIISNNPKEKEATNNNETIRFPQLKTLKLEDLPNFKSFICSHETQFFFSNKVIFPVLKKLSIRKMNKIIEIWDKQSTAVLEEQGFFCQLTDLDVSKCEKLMHVFHSKMHLPLKNLKVLHVSDCPTMEGIVEFEGEIDEDGLRNEVCFSELSSLELSSLPNLKSFYTKLEKAGTTEGNSIIHALPLFNRKVVFPILKTLKFKGLHKITRIWDNQPLSEPEKKAKSFSGLQYIGVGGCEHLEYVLPFYMLPQLKNLQELRIRDCRKMEVIISNNLKEKEAINNNDTIQFSQLKILELDDLPNFKSFICCETQLFFPNKVIFPVLRELSIRKIHKIIEIWDKQSIAVLEEQGSFCQLTDLDVSECEKLIHVFPSKMHSPLKNLKVLRVSDCPTMEGIVESEGEIDEDGLRNELCFSKLSSLELSGLANLESFCTKLEKAGTTEGNSIIHALPLFNRKVAFPVLETLKFKDLHKITRIWDEQPLPEQEKEAKSFCQLMVITVEDCDQLAYVLPFYMLPQLKNLQHLWIWKCRKMEVILANNPKEKEATNNNDTIRFPQLKSMMLWDLRSLKSFICTDETQLFFSNKDAFPVLEDIHLDEDSEILRDGTYTKEECSTCGEESDHNGEELDEDLETPTKEECGTSGKQNDHNGEQC